MARLVLTRRAAGGGTADACAVARNATRNRQVFIISAQRTMRLAAAP